jgi:intracellular septation protein
MKNLFESGKLLLLDMASTFFFLVIVLLTHNVILAVVLAMALGIAQIGWQFARKQPIDTMQWMSLFLVLGSGAATLITRDEIVPDIAVIFGYVWAGLMFFSAVLNLVVALNFSVVTWSASMSIYAIVSKAAMFLIQYATMRTIGRRRRRAQMVAA